MQIAIELTSFYSPGDERRFFDGLAELACIENVRGIGRALVFDLRLNRISKDKLWELIALLRRYGIGLAPLGVLASRARFAWLREPHWYWHANMFPDAPPGATDAEGGP